MKHSFLSLFLAMMLMFCSCTNNPGSNITLGHTPKTKAKVIPGQLDVENYIGFTVNNTPVTSSGWNISRSLMNNQLVLNVTSNMHDEPRTINLNINGDKPGRYKFLSLGGYNKPGFAYGSYFSNYEEDIADPYHFEEGEFIITGIDTIRGILNAEFSAIVKSGKGETLIITDGKITKGKLKPGITRY